MMVERLVREILTTVEENWKVFYKHAEESEIQDNGWGERDERLMYV